MKKLIEMSKGEVARSSTKKPVKMKDMAGSLFTTMKDEDGELEMYMIIESISGEALVSTDRYLHNT